MSGMYVSVYTNVMEPGMDSAHMATNKYQNQLFSVIWRMHQFYSSLAHLLHTTCFDAKLKVCMLTAHYKSS